MLYLPHCIQNKELQQVLKKLLIRKPKTEESFKLGIIRTEDPERKEEVVEDSNEWWVIIRLQVRSSSHKHHDK